MNSYAIASSAGEGRFRMCGLCVLLLVLYAVPQVVWDHADLELRQSIPKKWELYTLNVPTETDAPTVGIRLFSGCI